MAGMERLELSKPGLKNLSLDRFAFIPVYLYAGEENRTPKTLVLSERCLPVASPPRLSLHTFHASRITYHSSLIGSGVRSLTG